MYKLGRFEDERKIAKIVFLLSFVYLIIVIVYGHVLTLE